MTKTKIGMPKIKISFQQAANETVERSDRGSVYLVIRDETDGAEGVHTYKRASALLADQGKYTGENYRYISDALLAGPSEVVVIAIGEEDTVGAALEAIDKMGTTGRVTVADGTAEDYAALIAFAKTAQEEDIGWHVLTYGEGGADCKHVENLSSKIVGNVVWSDEERGTTGGVELLPRLAGILSACNVVRSATYYVLDDLIDIIAATPAEGETAADIEDEIDSGNLCLFNDHGTIRIARGVNTLQTLNDTDNTDDMRFIDVVETIDLLRDDIRSLFLNQYVGQVKNSADNQALFVGELITLMQDYASAEILDSDYDNTAAVDADAMRAYWEAAGTDTSEMSDDDIKKKIVGREVYVRMTFKPLRAMEGVTVVGTLE
ncbi:MAG: phage tail sheath C-terminal domain-containing protein [Eubacteriales bacterium]|nr:phage tail sheath C-terminal domain-containing protein [Eubacteriales bacterium]